MSLTLKFKNNRKVLYFFTPDSDFIFKGPFTISSYSDIIIYQLNDTLSIQNRKYKELNCQNTKQRKPKQGSDSEQT